ncbi:hypothetical protein ACFX1X_023384 [Malus domestica]
MLSYGKNFGDKRGLGFESEKTISSSSITRFVKAFDIPSSRVGANQGVEINRITRIISIMSTVVPKVRQVWRRKENQSGVLVNLSPPPSCLY